MATEDGTRAHAVIDELVDHSPSFEFAQLVRLLQGAAAGRASPGRSRDPAREAIRFRSRIGFDFPASDVHRVRAPDAPGGPAEVTVNFLGLASPTTRTALPPWYAREAIDQERTAPYEAVLRDFLDVFNHRLIGFFFRAWEKHSLPYHYDVLRDGGLLQRVLYSMIGLGSPALRDRLAVDDRVLLRHAGVLARRPVTGEGLLRILRQYFGDRFELEELVAVRMQLDPEDRVLLGAARFRLGQDTVAGTTVRVAQSHFRLRIGPLDVDAFLDYLPPDGARFRELRDLVRFAVGPEFEFDARLVLRSRDVPKLALGERGGARLGWSTWLGTRLTSRDADDTLVPVSLLEARR